MDTGRGADPDRLTTYEEVLKRWALNDCNAVRDSLGDDAIKELFRRWRATRSKPATVTGTVNPQALDRAWTAFVDRWNTEGDDEFTRKLRRREEGRASRSVSALAAQICELSWEADRGCCFVHRLKGCAVCRGYHISRPSDAEWRSIIDSSPLSATEERLIGRYQRALAKARRGSQPHRLTGLSHTPPRSPERQREARSTSRGSQLSAIGPSQRARYCRCRGMGPSRASTATRTRTLRSGTTIVLPPAVTMMP